MLKKLSEIYPDPNQHRKDFGKREMTELENSIRTHGFMENSAILIDSKGMIIAGERRYRASKNIGLTEIPCVVRDCTESERIELQLIENLCRSNVNPIEEARGFQDLMKHSDIKGVSSKIGKSTQFIQSRLNLLKLDPQYQQMVIDKRLALWQAQVMCAAIPEKQHKIYYESFVIDNKGKYSTKEKFIALCNRIIAPPAIQDEIGAELNQKRIGFEKGIDRVVKFVNKQFDTDDLSVLKTAETDTVKIDLLISHLEKVKAAVTVEKLVKTPDADCVKNPIRTAESVKEKIINHLTGRGNTHIEDLAKAIKEPEQVVQKILSEIGFKNISERKYIQKTGGFYRIVEYDKSEPEPESEPEAIPEKKGNPKIDIDGLKVMPNVKFKTDNERQRNKMWQKPFQIIPRIEYQRLLSILDDNLSDFFNDNGKLVTIGITHKDEYVLINVKEQFWGEYGL